jgi:hypothetical protein
MSNVLYKDALTRYLVVGAEDNIQVPEDHDTNSDSSDDPRSPRPDSSDDNDTSSDSSDDNDTCSDNSDDPRSPRPDDGPRISPGYNSTP